MNSTVVYQTTGQGFHLTQTSRNYSRDTAARTFNTTMPMQNFLNSSFQMAKPSVSESVGRSPQAHTNQSYTYLNDKSRVHFDKPTFINFYKLKRKVQQQNKSTWSCYCQKESADSWNPQAREAATFIAGPNDRIYLFGGINQEPME